jgi:hypothetical protein
MWVDVLLSCMHQVVDLEIVDRGGSYRGMVILVRPSMVLIRQDEKKTVREVWVRIDLIESITTKDTELEDEEKAMRLNAYVAYLNSCLEESRKNAS